MDLATYLERFTVSLSALDRKIILFFEQNEIMDREHIAKMVLKRYSTIHPHIMKLIKYKILERTTILTDTRGRPQYKYRIMPFNIWRIDV
jgi:predicted transcriptional regulator